MGVFNIHLSCPTRTHFSYFTYSPLRRSSMVDVVINYAIILQMSKSPLLQVLLKLFYANIN